MLAMNPEVKCDEGDCRDVLAKSMDKKDRLS